MGEEPTKIQAKCMRCGNTYECDLQSAYLPETCHPCFSKVTAPLYEGREANTRKFNRLVDRYRKGRTSHPTWKALDAYYDAPAGDCPW